MTSFKGEFMGKIRMNFKKSPHLTITAMMILIAITFTSLSYFTVTSNKKSRINYTTFSLIDSAKDIKKEKLSTKRLPAKE